MQEKNPERSKIYIERYKNILYTAQVLMHMAFEIFVNEDCLAIQCQKKNSSNPIKLMPSIFIRNHNGKTVSFLTGENQNAFTEAFCTNKGVLSVLFVHLQ